jgi:hypothetical protein
MLLVVLRRGRFRGEGFIAGKLERIETMVLFGVTTTVSELDGGMGWMSILRVWLSSKGFVIFG